MATATELFFGQHERQDDAAAAAANKPAVQHMSMLNGVPVAQPAVPVAERERAAATSSQLQQQQQHAPGSTSRGISSTSTTTASAVRAEAAPSIAGISKIRPAVATAAAPAANAPPRPQRIIVPQRIIQGGLDNKFDPDPYGMNLHGMLTPPQYKEAIEQINYTMRKARSNGIDTALLVTGPLLVPLAVWGARHSRQMKKRKKLLLRAIDEFNGRYPHLYMRWNRNPQSMLTIERRNVELHGAAPGMIMGGGVGAGAAGGHGAVPGFQQQVGDVNAIGEEDAFV